MIAPQVAHGVAVFSRAGNAPDIHVADDVPLAIGMIPIVVAAAVVVTLLWRCRVRDADVAWLAGSRDVGPAERLIYAAHLSRHRAARLAGGVIGVLTATVVGLWWNDLTVTVGTGVASGPAADTLFAGVTGVLLGALAAEGHRLRPASAPVAASLAPRVPSPRGWAVLAARAMAGIVLALGAASALVSRDPWGLAGSFVLLTPFALAEGVRQSVLGRARPVMTARAARVDGRLQLFAEAVAARLGLAATLVALAWALALAPLDDTSMPAVDWGVISIASGSLAAAIVTLWFAAPRPRWGMPLRPGDERARSRRLPTGMPAGLAAADATASDRT